jgi:hypothetical protein
MCCLDPQRYFGPHYSGIGESFSEIAVLPDLDGLPSECVSVEDSRTRELSAHRLFGLASATEMIQ